MRKFCFVEGRKARSQHLDSDEESVPQPRSAEELPAYVDITAQTTTNPLSASSPGPWTGVSAHQPPGLHPVDTWLAADVGRMNSAHSMSQAPAAMFAKNPLFSSSPFPLCWYNGNPASGCPRGSRAIWYCKFRTNHKPSYVHLCDNCKEYFYEDHLDPNECKPLL